MNSEKNEKIALILGFFLILVVITITLFRSRPISNPDVSAGQVSQDSKTTGTLPYQTINAKDLQKKILLNSKKESITLLDIRTFEEYVKEHIVDAVNISADDYPISSTVDAHNYVIVVGTDASDPNIAKTVDELKKENFSNFVVLADGMNSWKQLVGATVTFGDPTSFVDQSKVSYVDPETLAGALKQNVPMFIVDVRTSDDYAKGHIPGAKNIPSDDLEPRRSEINQSKVVVVGLNELQEFQAAVKMYDMLLVSPYVMRGAMTGWQQKGFPVTK